MPVQDWVAYIHNITRRTSVTCGDADLTIIQRRDQVESQNERNVLSPKQYLYINHVLPRGHT